MNNVFIWVIMIAPAISATMCLCFLTISRTLNQDKMGLKVRHVLQWYFLAMIISWVTLALYSVFPDIFVYFSSLCYTAFLLVQIFFYHIIYLLTRKENDRPFTWLHYLLPFLIGGTLAIWSLFVPIEAQLQVVNGRGTPAEGYLYFSYFANSRLTVRFIFSLIYTVLSFYRLLRYRKEVVNYSADEYRSSLSWIYVLLLLSLPLNAAPVAGILFDRAYLLGSFVVLLPAVILLIQHPVLCYNVLTHNYVIMGQQKGIPVTSNPVVKCPTARRNQLTRETFETFISENKPYLRSELKITDITDTLNSNRTYLSAFINREYGVNFNTYINTLRLRELDKLRSDPANREYTNLELIARAGFGSYHSYLRSKNRIQGGEALATDD